MGEWYIDINCDVGEGIGNEAELLPLINSCNIACGGHAGDSASMEQVVALAQNYNVKIGAHPSYPDKPNFGRQVMPISDDNLKTSIIEQLARFDEVLQNKNAALHHIKAHGALYNETAKDGNLAKLYLDAIESYRESAFLYVPYGSRIAQLAIAKGFKIIYEAFADRNYNHDLSLVSRQNNNALIENPQQVLEHMLPIIKEGVVKTISNKRVAIKADTLCIHGDTLSALQILMYLSQELPHHGIQLK
ncbi:5-oxoprolinase subunit PxpA [Flagellimonas sp. S3867]|uniref:5-oxoprolinase subunit PxpA n=1 Tax=Flagellimonas sp. S3867 TaxID=2768063 RepID=UPI0016864E0B|nr:5-oxoprolinase subunit PxpA [Flagellimonas sp. S3867]